MRFENKVPEFKSKFKNELHDFVVYKRSNGYQYGDNMCYRLLQLDKYFLTIDDDKLEITQDIVDSWLKICDKENKSSTKGRYFGAISAFCEYLRIKGYENVIQPNSHHLKFKSDFIPYIFSDEEIDRMFKIAKQNLEKANYDIDELTFFILLNLYYCCGLRKMEALNLKLDDYNSREKTIIIENSKNDVTRQIPLNESLNNLIMEYISKRKSNSDYIFVNLKGTNQYSDDRVYLKYKELLVKAEIPIRYDGKRQRLHDLRHTFAVNSLKQMEIKGFDLYTSLPILSVYLGHKNIIETEYYLRLIEKEADNIEEKSRNYLKNLYLEKEYFKHEQ